MLKLAMLTAAPLANVKLVTSTIMDKVIFLQNKSIKYDMYATYSQRHFEPFLGTVGLKFQDVNSLIGYNSVAREVVVKRSGFFPLFLYRKSILKIPARATLVC